ncbi:MAG: hypothetical protein WC981_03500 [Candidatus Dojkabacteria bacterium]
MTDKLKEAMANRYKEEASEKVNFAYDSIVGDKIKGKISEEGFKYFLPYFSGELPLSKDNNVVAQWISIAGTPMSEVVVVDAKGQVVFTVPPLFDSNGINITNRRERNSFADISSDFIRMNVSTPIAANNFLNNSLHKKVEEIVDHNHKPTMNQERWNSILKRYGKEVESETKETKTSSNDNASDDLVYD